MVEIALAVIKLFANLVNGVIFIISLGPRAIDTFSRRIWSKAERIDSGNYLESHSVQIAFDNNRNALAVSNEYNKVWAKFFTPVAGWSMAEVIDDTRTSDTLDDNTRGGKNDPWITFDIHGNAIAVWDQDVGYDSVMGSKHETWSNRYTAGVGWDQAERFDHTPGETRPVKIVRDTQGNALAVWTHFANNISTLWAKNYTTATGWNNAIPISSTNGDVTIMQLTFDVNGNALVLWRKDKDGKNTLGLYSVFVIYYVASTGWGEAKIISKITNSYQMQTLKFAFDPCGNVIVVWSQLDSTDNEKQIHIWAKRYSIDTGWVKAVKIDPGVISRYSEHVSDSLQPEIAFDVHGDAIVVWTQRKDSSHSEIWTNRYTASKGWGSAICITKTDSHQPRQQLAIDHRGNALAVWALRNGVGASYYTFDAGWSEPEHIYDYYSGDGYESFDPKIAFDAEGNAIAVWWHQFHLYTTIWSRQYSAGTGWGKLAPIKRDYTNKATDPLIFVGPNGVAHVVWKQRDLHNSHVHFWTSHVLKARD